MNMSETFKEFVKFISDDPLMLGLCCAIVVLVILFILVLCFGGKKKKTNEEASIDNTASLLKPEAGEEVLRSTQQISLSAINDNMVSPVEEETPVPSVEAPLPAYNSDTFEPVMPKVETVTEPAFVAPDPLPKEPVMPQVTPVPFEMSTPVAMDIPKPAMEPVMPEAPVVNVNTFEPVVSEPINYTEPIIPDMPMPSVEPVMGTQPFSSVYAPGTQTMESVQEIPVSPQQYVNPVVEEPVMPEVLPVEEDIDLPKLSTNQDTSVLGTLTGESFNIN